jgi:hypothetical protein
MVPTESQTSASPSSNSSSLPLIKKGRFYFIFEDASYWVLEDKTKRGLEVKEKTNDPDKNVLSDKGVIYDMDGRGHKVNIRWFYPKNEFSVHEVENNAQIMEKRYREIQEITCPSD